MTTAFKIMQEENQTFVTDMRSCQRCGHFVAVQLVRDITSSGISQIYWFCKAHNGAINSPRINISHEKIQSQKIAIDKLPVINDYSNQAICAVCGHVGAELHHWAPRHLFSDSADDWPTGYLCTKCHLLWHRLVTPNMGAKHD